MARRAPEAVDFDLAALGAGRGELHLDGGLRKKFGDLAGPFDDDEALLIKELEKADGFQVVSAGGAVGVEVINRQLRRFVDVEEDEGGAGDLLAPAAESFDQAADELGFAGAQLAV